jgi:hypothetical protein
MVAPFFQTFLRLLWFYKPTDGRFIHLEFVRNGFNKTGAPWVEYDGKQLIPFCAVDDIGIYWIIPRIGHIMNCSVENAICLFFYGIAVFAWLVGLVSFFLVYRTIPQRTVAAVGLTALLVLTLYIGDVYILYSAAVMAIMPLGMYLCLTDNKLLFYGLFGTFIGFFVGIAHFCRSYSGIPPLLFILVLCWLQFDRAYWKKIILTSFIFIGFLAVALFVGQEKKKYHAFIQKSYPTVTLNQYEHGTWHTIYCGLGFFKFMNKQHIEWSDSYVHKFVEMQLSRQENTGLKGEQILKAEVFNIIKNESNFVICSLFGKLGILILLLLLSANIGLMAALIFRKSFIVDISFLLALCSSAVFPILAMPFLTYGLSFIACAVIYSIVSINHAIQVLYSKKYFSMCA